jgi:hypothetical protein
MGHWSVVIPAERYRTERLFLNDAVELGGVQGPAAGDEVVLVAGGAEPVVFGLGRVGAGGVAYTHRLLDEPLPAAGLVPDEPGAHRLDDAAYAAVAGRIGVEHRVDAPKRTWLVSLDLPIEASSPAEAVRTFWTFVIKLGPTELPAFVSPSGDELAMQAFVLGEETNLDPEEED